MTKKFELKAVVRKSEEKPAEIRKNSFVPAIVYGTSIEPKMVKIKKQDFDKIYSEAGESSLIDLVIDSEDPVKVLVKDVQNHIVKNEKVHIDFHVVDMNKTITTEIPLNFIGVSKAEKELGGVLNKTFNALEIECLPGDLVNHIDIDISVLAEINDHIQIKDIDTGDKIKVLNDPENVVVSVTEKVIEVEPEPEAELPAEEGEEKKEGDKEEKPEDKKEEKK